MEHRKQVFPQELLDHVVDEIGQAYIDSSPSSNNSDTQFLKTLLSLLSVSRFVHDRAIAPLFRSVRLHRRKGRQIPERIAVLQRILKPTPGSTLRTVAPCIRKFTLDLARQRSPKDALLDERTREEQNNQDQQWLGEIISNDETLGLFNTLHRECSRIHELAILWDINPALKWSELPLRSSSSLLTLIRSPHLQSLHLYNIYRLPPTLLRGSKLKSLRLDKEYYGYFNDPLIGHLQAGDPEECNLPFPKLVTFQTDNLHSFLVDLHSPASALTELKKLTINIILPNHDHHISIGKILRLTHNTLEDISLDFSGTIMIPAESVDIGSMPRLRTLTLNHFRSCMDPYQPVDDASMDRICEILDARCPLNSLTEITLKIQFADDVGGLSDFQRPEPNSHWQEIDSILTGEKYPALRKINIQIHSTFPLPGSARKEFKQNMHRCLCEALARLLDSDQVDLKVDFSLL